MLIHGGDHTRRGSLEELRTAISWLHTLPHRYKVSIGGNHDFCLDGMGYSAHGLLDPILYLEDEMVEIEGLRIYGSPWTPEHGRWAFQAPRGGPLAHVWSHIPEGTQLLVTHGPPAGIHDRTSAGEHVGCADLRDRVRVVRPLLHLFGHIHESYGVSEQDGTLFVNGSNCSLGYTYPQWPHVFDWDGTNFTAVTCWRAADPLWSFLLDRNGPPRDLRGLPEGEWRAELELGHAFWLEISGSELRFRMAVRGESPAGGPSYPLSFGVKMPSHWMDLLGKNSWTSLDAVPGLELFDPRPGGVPAPGPVGGASLRD